MPNVILCPHENTAAHMAAGYALMTGRGQGVLVHVDVGTANSATAMHNIFRSPAAGAADARARRPIRHGNELVGSRDTYVHFVQEPFDQGSLVRPYVKWEWTLPSGIVVKEALRRAHNHHGEPTRRGPVYFMAQRETLTQHWKSDEVRSFSAEQFASAQSGGADPALISRSRRPAAQGRASDPDHRLCRTHPRAPRKLIDAACPVRRHRRVRRQHDLQHLA